VQELPVGAGQRRLEGEHLRLECSAACISSRSDIPIVLISRANLKYMHMNSKFM
jgi:hypothetical protein